MTVVQLIEVLKILPPDAVVFAWTSSTDRLPVISVDHWDAHHVDLNAK